MGRHLDTFRHLCNTNLQLQRVVMQAFGICCTKVARQQLRCFQRYLGPLLSRDRVTVQACSALEMRDVTNAMGKGFESSEPIIEIESRTPLLIKLSKQHTHRTAEHDGRLADEAVGAKAQKPNCRRQGRITLD